MPQLIKPQEVKIVTKDGEVSVAITLELNVNLNATGLEVSAQAKEIKTIEKPKEDKFDWALPDFGSSPKINFGKNE